MATAGKTWFKASKKGARADIRIFNEIGGYGVSAQDFHDTLSGFGDVSDIHLAISSDGGDVSHGTAIYNILNRHKANKVVTIEGLAASMASVIAMAGDTVVMPANAMMMIHNPWGGVMGEAEQVKSFGEALEIMQANIAQAYVTRTGIAEDEILAMMGRETWLSAERAVKLGFADRIEDARDFNARAFDVTKFNRAPKSLRASTRGANMADKKDTTSESEDTGTKDAKAMRADIVKANKEVRSMCALAGFPELADGYIADDLSVSQVVNKLAEAKDAKAKDSKAGGGDVRTRNASTTDRPAATIDAAKIYGRWNERKK